MIDIVNEVSAAHERIKPYVRETLLDYSVPLSRALGVRVFLKCENLQYTGSFKVRGALNKLLVLTSEERSRGVVAASTGNHGAAVAFGLQKLKIPGIIFVPENASKTKIENIGNYEIPIEYHGQDCVETELFARNYAAEKNMIYISPYNDKQVVSGQGTIGIELLKQFEQEQIDAVFVPVGGGGLISGIGAYLKESSPNTRIIGCLPENSPVMYNSILANRVVDMETTETLSDATAGGIEAGSITFELCQKYVDDYILVSETEIKRAIIAMLKTQHLLVEGAAGVALAALFKNRTRFQNKNAVVVLSGANISLENLKVVLKHDENN